MFSDYKLNKHVKKYLRAVTPKILYFIHSFFFFVDTVPFCARAHTHTHTPLMCECVWVCLALYIYIYIYIYFSLSVSISVSVSVSLSIYIYAYVCMFIYIYIRWSLNKLLHLLYRSNNFWLAQLKSSCVIESIHFVTASFFSSIVS